MNFDVLIIGAGLAGLATALRFPENIKIALIAKQTLDISASHWAQGGVAGVIDNNDRFELHEQDTISAGAGLCNEQVVRHVIKNSKDSIQWLIDQGVEFTKSNDNQSLHLTKEGGHSLHRIAHVKDFTGKAIQEALIKEIKIKKNITIFENHSAVDLILLRKIDPKSKENACLGAYVLDKSNDSIKTLSAKYTVLATGGTSKAYLYTTNPPVSTGDGVAMAWRAGCKISNMEFIQFHPTCLFHPMERSFLISETIRGEGGILKLPNGEPFMYKYHPSGDLAPRDIVARAIDNEMKQRGLENVFLDISMLDENFIQKRFPSIYQHCKNLKIDITKEPIPVVPAAHYSCGGVKTDLNAETSLHNLYAIGETACTGLHGANRLASNSLLECLVFSKSAVEHIYSKIPEQSDHSPLPDWDESRVTNPDEAVMILQTWNELRRFMWNYVGIVRTNQRLNRAYERIEILKKEVQHFYKNFHITSDLIELRNLLQVSELIVLSALARKESRGLHFSKDYPEKNDEAIDTMLQLDNEIN
jgi:L-aspartate oxidase